MIAYSILTAACRISITMWYVVPGGESDLLGDGCGRL